MRSPAITVRGRRPPDRPPASTIPEHVRRTLKLAIPVMIARAGLVIMVTVDTIMVGQVSSDMLAYYGISLAPHVTLLVLGIGLMAATTILSAQAEGGKRQSTVGGIWRTSLLVGGGLGLIEAVLLAFGPQILLLLGQTDDMATVGGHALQMFAFGMPAIFLFLACTNFLEGIGRPKVGMVITLSGNLVNAGFNYLLIEGHLGFPAMGAAGATLATTITRWCMFGAALGYLFLVMRDRKAYDIRFGGGFHLATAKKQLRLGLPLSVSIAIQTSAMMLVTAFAGWQGKATVAAYQICNNVVGFVFMLSIGLSTATAVRVANAIGRGDDEGRAKAAWVGLGMVLSLQLCVGLGIFLLRPWLARAYTPDLEVVALAIPGLAIVAIAVVMDGAHNVVQGSLRAHGDVLFPLCTYLTVYWVVSLPISYLLGYRLDWGTQGFLLGNLVGYCLAFVALALRFRVMAAREVRPI